MERMNCMNQAERDVALAEAERQQQAKETAEALCHQLTAEVARLEATIRQLEQQNLHSNSDLPAPADQVSLGIISIIRYH